MVRPNGYELAGKLAHAREFEIRRQTTIPLSRAAAAGHRNALRSLTALAADPEPGIAGVANVALAAVRASLAGRPGPSK
jgi:hypothetical protein